MNTSVKPVDTGVREEALVGNLEGLRGLGQEAFEDICAAVFKQSGFFVEPTGLGPGYGIDLILATVGEGGYADDWLAMRCLCTVGEVGEVETKAFMEAMESEGFDRGIVVTTGSFEAGAVEAAAGHADLRLVDGLAFLEKLAGLSGEARREVAAVAAEVA
ncbi:MAG: restriction endonuclease [Verrucomicrobiota bacterium]